MNEKNEFEWIAFHQEFASKLLNYKAHRTELVEKVKAIYANTGMNMPTLERNNNLIDIDPFTVFGLFNKKLTDNNRMKILTAIAELFDVKAPVPTSFDSLPVLNPQNATFYYFVDERGEEDIDDLWDLFDSALSYAKEPTEEHREIISHYFDVAINKKGNGNSKITMALYWISPDSFLNLDSRNEWYIYKSEKIPVDVVNELPAIEPKISASKYFQIVEVLRRYLQSSKSTLKDFKELSFAAWKYSEQVNQEHRTIKVAMDENSTLADNVDGVRYWVYAPGEGSSKWDEFYNAGMMAIGWGEIGDLRAFNTKDAMKKKLKETFDPTLSYKNVGHATWQFVNEMKVGDVVFAKKGSHQLVGRGIVTSEYEFDGDRSDEYKNIRQVNWTHCGEWEHPGKAAIKTLTDVTPYTDYVEQLNALFEDESEEDVEEVELSYPIYNKGNIL